MMVYNFKNRKSWIYPELDSKQDFKHYLKGVFMKIITKNSATGLKRLTPFFGAILMAGMILPAIAAGPTTVNLGTAGNFAVLAGSLISNVPTSAIVCDVGLSPAAGSNMTGFGSTEVTGTIYAVDVTGPAGSVPNAGLLTLAKNDLTTAYTDAANRTPVPAGAFLNPGSGNLGGMTLVPGLYKFTSDALITGGNVTLTGSASDVWIFQIGSALTVGSGIKVILDGGAKAANVFWQVGSSATIGTGAAFKGTIMADQSITLMTGATLDGRALARIAAVTLASTTINCASDTLNADTIRPTVSFTIPVNGALCVPVNSKVVVATFSEKMDSSTFTSETYGVKFGTTPVSGTVSYTGTSVTFAPAAGNLPPNTTFIATITTGAKDLAGNSMAANYVWSFTTCETPDTTTPIIIAINNGLCVPINSKIASVFSEMMNPLTITSSTYFLQNGAILIPGTVVSSGSNAIFTPDVYFTPKTQYTVTLKSGGPATGVHDMVCNTLYSDYVWSFTTCDTTDTKPPTVTYIGLDTITPGAIIPIALSKKANPSAFTTAQIIISFAFSKKMDPLTITTGTVTLRQGPVNIPGTVFAIDTIAYFTPTVSLEPNAVYTTTITTGVKDLAANALADNFVWNFTAGTAVKGAANSASSKSFALSLWNYPNPFSLSTKIQYRIEMAAQVTLKVYNSLGNEVATLVNGRQEAGSYTVPFISKKGTLSLSNGTYFCRLETGSFVSMRKLIIMK